MEINLHNNAGDIANLVIQAGKPHKDSSTRLLYLSGRSLGANSEVFTDLLDDLTSKVLQSKQSAAIEQHRQCLRHVLNSLICCIFRFEWLSLPTNPSNFIEGEYLRKMGFSQRRMKRIIELLQEQGIIELGRKGYLDDSKGGTPMASQFFPTEKFIRLFSDSLYSCFGDFDNYDPYNFQRFDVIDKPSSKEIKEKSRVITNYNDYMRDHSWAMKSPSSRSIKDFVGRSGRINNYYQALANRRIKLRTSTLIDGERISEPDFSCNHLRMSSYLVGEELPADPYTVIAEETGLSRDVIKTVITICIGARKLSQKGAIIMNARKLTKKRVEVSSGQFKSVIASLEHSYPWVKTEKLLFNDIGTRMQYLEGEIALKMMQWSVEDGVPLLAVHDAFAVRHFDEDKTYSRMLEVWLDVLKQAKEDNYIESTQYTVGIALERDRREKLIKAETKGNKNKQRA